ncbi:PorT family protein [Hymenobacter sp. BRD128]|uniref:porin family protein n=1 Tax=Hymenobacter sp. BRD128 TaxID=2675878 RepID=UPI0015675558|nr:porin family protein [Hymenobacter sp. BRD128]QKG57230.1 PorT family protein [Hymenobacter sp. BRD128]
MLLLALALPHHSPFYISSLHTMKKTFLALVLAVGAAGAAQAQSARFGVKAGASLTNVTNSGDQAAYKFGFNGGVMANFAVNDMFSIQPEVLYSNKGLKEKDSSDNTRLALNYIDVPVLAKIATGATGLFFELGPQVGFRASADYKNSSASLSLNDAIKSVDFGYAAGLGFQAASGGMIGLRYNGGFTNVAKDNGTIMGVPVTGGDGKNSAFQLYIGYLFGGK